MSEKENWDTYGKCSNPKGHGHNYVLEIDVCGVSDKKTGRIVDVQKLDGIVNERILAEWDHKFLDEEVEDFSGKVSTGENMVQIVWEKLNKCLPGGQLFCVRLSETSNAYFEYFGEHDEVCT